MAQEIPDCQAAPKCALALRMNRVAACDPFVLRGRTASLVNDREIGMKLIDVEPTVFLCRGFHSFAKSFQRSVVAREGRRSRLWAIERLRCDPRGAHVCLLGLVSHPLQTIDVGLEDFIAEGTVLPVVHPEVNRHGRRVMDDDVALEPRVAAS